MNIADLVTQVHGGEEEEDEELQQDATLGEQQHSDSGQPGRPMAGQSMGKRIRGRYDCTTTTAGQRCTQLARCMPIRRAAHGCR